MRLTQRNSTIGVLVLQASLALVMLVAEVLAGTSSGAVIGTVVGVAVFIGLAVAYVRGWEPARHAAVIITTLLAGALMPEPYVTQQVAISILIPPVLALILTRPLWVVLSTVVSVGALLARAGFAGVYADPLTLVAIGMVVGGMILARIVTDTAQRAAEDNARSAAEQRERAEQRAAELDAASRRLEEELTRQRALLELVDTLETPVVRLAAGVLFAPIIGHLDSRRADRLVRRLLDEVHTSRAGMMIVDIAGVPMVDTAVAATLVRMVQSLRMLGCEVVISGISAPVATSLVHLGASLGDIRTVRSPEEALQLLAARN